MSSTTTKSKIGSEDISLYDGVSGTFTRKTSTGGDVTLSKLGYEVDVAIAHGDGNTTLTAINTAIAALGSLERVLVLRHGTWTISSNLTIPSNIHIILSSGATFAISAGIAVTAAGPFEIYGNLTLGAAAAFTASSNLYVIKPSSIALGAGSTFTASGTVHAGPFTLFTGTGTAVISGRGIIYGNWFVTPLTSPSTLTSGIGSLFVAVSGANVVWFKDSVGWVQIDLTDFVTTTVLASTVADYVALIGDETIAGVKTFSSFPVTPSSSPTTDYQVANKSYVDSAVAAGADPESLTIQDSTYETQTNIITYITEITAFNSAAYHDVAGAIPSGVFVIGVCTRVTETIAGPATISIGYSGNTTYWGSARSKNAASTTDLTDQNSSGPNAPMVFGHPGYAVRITANGGNFTGGAGNGKLRIAVHYIELQAPQS
jgi:hypothetical protein